MQKHTRTEKKIHLNFSKHNAPCILTRRVCAFTRRRAAGSQPSSGRFQPGPPQDPPWTHSKGRSGGILRWGPGLQLPKASHLRTPGVDTGLALHREGQVTRAERLQTPDTAFCSFTLGGAEPLSEPRFWLSLYRSETIPAKPFSPEVCCISISEGWSRSSPALSSPVEMLCGPGVLQPLVPGRDCYSSTSGSGGAAAWWPSSPLAPGRRAPLEPWPTIRPTPHALP